MSPTSYAVLAGAAALAMGGGAAWLAFYAWRRLGQPWRLWWLGAGAFLTAQVAQVPLLSLLGPLMQANQTSGLLLGAAVNVALAGLAAGLCQEIGRYVALRRFSGGAGAWAEGVMFGAGASGADALLLGAGGLVQSAVLLAKGDQMLAEVQRSAPHQVEAVQETIRHLREEPVQVLLASVWERGVAMAVHVALSLVVLRAARSAHPARWGWVAAAVAVHVAVNGAAAALMRATGRNVLAVEAVLAAVGVAALLWIRRERLRWPAEPRQAAWLKSPEQGSER